MPRQSRRQETQHLRTYEHIGRFDVDFKPY